MEHGWVLVDPSIPEAADDPSMGAVFGSYMVQPVKALFRLREPEV